eukprot:TRINITY_DN19208_c0_g1_i1.p1 TRINITY_DN19208_c0_g1~~TRINITY_DN19208_c0_g1_i1.p1  ORF type:complete len:885 (+),score=266.62 TRINITY_DN19208_c0_g1_i1:194-2848(+)
MVGAMKPTVNFVAMSTKEVGAKLRDLFTMADLNGDGFLDYDEFVMLLRSPRLEFSRATIIRMIDSIDFSFENKIDYGEFVPIMVELIEELKERALAPHKAEAEEAQARETAIDYLLRSLPQDDAPSYMTSLFRTRDIDCDGVLTRDQFFASLRELDAGLTTGEMGFLAAEIESANSGEIAFDSIVDTFFETLVDVVAGSLLENSGRFVYWQNLLLRNFGSLDEIGDGQLSPDCVMEALLGIGFTTVQAEQLRADATIARNGTISYPRFARIAALRALAQFGTEMPAELRGDTPSLEQISLDELVFFLRKRFLEADVDRNGVLNQAEFADLLRSMGMGLTKQVFRRVMEESDTHRDGWIEYSEFVPIVLDLIKTRRVIAEQRQIREAEEGIYRAQARAHLMQGMPKDHLEGSLITMFKESDQDGNGTLGSREFLDCLKQMNLGLDRTEIAELMDAVDHKEDGAIMYEPFVPLAFALIVEVLKEQFIDIGGPLREMQSYFRDQFSEQSVQYDHLKVLPKISRDQARTVLAKNKLSVIQIESILDEVKFDEHRTAICKTLARVVAPIAFKFLGGSLPEFGSPTRVKSPSKLALVSPIAREFADFKAIQIDAIPANEALLKAAREGDCNLLSVSLTTGSVDTSAADANGYSALHWAAMGGHFGACQILTAQGADPDARDGAGWTALHHAARGGHFEAVNKLLDGGADLNCATTDMFGRTAVQLSAWGGHADVVKLLLEYGATIDDKDNASEMNALHYASRYNRLAVVNTLVEFGASLETGTTDGKTALHFAANEGHLHLVHALVSAGANMEAVSSDQYARTPIHCAAYNGHFNVVQYLVSQGARVESLDADGISALTLGEHNPEICAAISTGQANNYQLRLEPPQTGF